MTNTHEAENWTEQELFNIQKIHIYSISITEM